jgi:hypothetical protein
MPPPASAPTNEIGAMADRRYSGDGLTVVPTASGARLHSAFQKLNGDATRGGLWITSTSGGDDGRLRLMAAALGRDSGTAKLAGSGVVDVADGVATFSRARLVEEYRTSVDGVRQDFVIGQRPGGDGQLRVELRLEGARAQASASGARLTLDGSGRELSYSRLTVVDATGRTLSATLDVVASNRLSIRVDDKDATYPVRIDPTFSDADWVSVNPGVAGTNGTVSALVADASNNLYIGGSFSLVGGQHRNGRDSAGPDIHRERAGIGWF